MVTIEFLVFKETTPLIRINEDSLKVEWFKEELFDLKIDERWFLPYRGYRYRDPTYNISYKTSYRILSSGFYPSFFLSHLFSLLLSFFFLLFCLSKTMISSPS